MPIRFLPNGVFEFDTVEEAMQFRALTTEKNGACTTQRASTTTGAKTPAGADFEGFFKELESHQKELLRGIANATDTLTTDILAKQVDKEPGQVGPMLRHIRTKAIRFHIDPNKLIRSEKERLNVGERASKVYTTRYADQINACLQNE